MNTSLLEQELAPLNARVKEVKTAINDLEMQMSVAQSELDMSATDRLCFDALRDACNALDRLAELEVGRLFWEVMPEVGDPQARLAVIRGSVARFDEEIRGSLERKAGLKAQFDRRREELESLYDAIHDAHAREERREEEFLVERELCLPEHVPVMPWSNEPEVERRYRRTMSTAMLLSLLLFIVTRLVTLPPPVHPVIAEVPERLAMMVRKEIPKPVPPKKAREEKKEAEKEQAKKETPAEKTPEKKQAVAQQERAQEHPAQASSEQAAAPSRSRNTGVLAFKDSFKDLIDETPVPKLGAEARVNNANAAGQAVASRSLVALQGGAGGGGYGAVSRNVGNGGSGGIGSAAVGRGIGGGKEGRLGRGSAGFSKVQSGIAGAGGAKEGRPLSSNARASRTDEEIQILFDRYKAALYRIYNTQLRKDPTLRGKMVLKIAIEPSGAVSACSVDSTNINATEFCEQIVDRVRKFNFGPKDGVPKTTILYPIDFLPAR